MANPALNQTEVQALNALGRALMRIRLLARGKDAAKNLGAIGDIADALHNVPGTVANTTEAEWPRKTPVLIDPSKKKGIFISLAVVVALVVFSLKSNEIVSHFVDSHNRDMLHSQMSQLAAEGKPDAVVWMIKNDSDFRSDTSYAALRAAAESGHPESMFLYSRVLKYQNNDKGAQEYVARAAAEGYPDAVLAVANKE